jgi:hypothetical protein
MHEHAHQWCILIQTQGSQRDCMGDEVTPLFGVVPLTCVALLMIIDAMTRGLHIALLFCVLLLAAIGLGGCTDNPVGRICDLGVEKPAMTEVVLTSPSLDCVSRTCLRMPPPNELPEGSKYPEGNNGLCTASCEEDDDCDRVPESPCVTGFTCGVAVTVGPFCCRKVCICKDYVVIPEGGGLATPKACDPSNAENACCNLSGRVGSSDYPLCNL